MSLLVTVTLFRPTFHGHGRTGEVQWPPSPIRLLGALKQGAHSLESSDTARRAHDALNRLVAAPPPIIHTSDHRDLAIPDTYTDRTWLPSRLSATHGETAVEYLGLEHFGMDSHNRVAKPQGAVALAGRRLEFRIEIELEPEHIEALDAAARLVPYFGRSNDPAMLNVLSIDDTYAASRHLIAWHPSKRPMGHLLGWQPNTIAWMDENHRRRFSEDGSINVLPTLPPDAYTQPLSYSRAVPRQERMHVLELPTSVPQPRAPALMREIAEVLPPQWRALPLTASLHPQSDGRLAGIGLLPLEIAEVPPPLAAVNAVINRCVYDRAAVTSGAVRTLDPSTWTRSAIRWTSTTPLRGFPDIRVLSYNLCQETQEHFGTGVTITEAHSEPHRRGEHRWPSSAYSDGLAQWWLEIEFDGPVEGPLALGASTDHGFGMFLPHKENR
ncbi:type I-U CRISPR-associated protein Csb2 [Brevibacterium sp.]|uniref:type I-G CRISPR-associated protein Csb2 n=1 Tax=Brevibacterium sp. TaxID=1701 RepID=UPI002810A828|nr:type I-U CRISPR-associated protein Csb2 [Brevibacterium sp.]